MDPATLAPAADCVAPLPPWTPNPSAITTGGKQHKGKSEVRAAAAALSPGAGPS